MLSIKTWLTYFMQLDYLILINIDVFCDFFGPFHNVSCFCSKKARSDVTVNNVEYYDIELIVFILYHLLLSG